jgi:Zn-dependent peptidase ImmA (M78 family)
MAHTTYTGLRELRERLFGFRLDTVADLARLSSSRLREIEAGEDPSVDELETLAEAYGLDADLLWEEPIVIPRTHMASALASQSEFRELGDMTRARLIRASRAAQDLVRLRTMLGEKSEPLPVLTRLDPRDPPYKQGAMLAHELRAKLSLGAGPIRSMRDLLTMMLPGVAVLLSDLGGDGPAGLAFAYESHGPTIVLNLRGKNENPSVRRFSLAHEICHLFADWDRSEPLATISGYLSDTGLDREQRANGFAVRFLCPETVGYRLKGTRDEDAVRVLVDEYKLHYRAAQLYLRNEANIHLPEKGPTVLPDHELESLETWPAVRDFPLDDVPYERRGPLADLAVRAWCAGRISRDACASFLGVTPVAEIERVADFLGIELTAAALAG